MVTPKKADWHEKFIELLSNHANVTLAAHGAGISRKTAYEHRKTDADFAQQWAYAIQQAVDTLEAEAWKRARRTSDTLLIFLLKAHRPAVYRERYEITHRFARLQDFIDLAEKQGYDPEQLLDGMIDELSDNTETPTAPDS